MKLDSYYLYMYSKFKLPKVCFYVTIIYFASLLLIVIVSFFVKVFVFFFLITIMLHLLHLLFFFLKGMCTRTFGSEEVGPQENRRGDG